MHRVSLGQAVVFVDKDGVAHDALVTHVWHGLPNTHDQCDLTYVVVKGPSEGDTFGVQVARVASVSHIGTSYCKSGRFGWRHVTEEV